MERLKRAAAIHDISGFGKCSLTVALPIISAMGIEVSVIPTAVLSTHTGGFTGFTYRDLTGDMRPIAEHWKSLGIKFDAIYSGFLGSVESKVVLTGVAFDGRQVGSASYDRSTDEISYALSDTVDGYFHGTGDVFASALLGAYVNGLSLAESARIAVDYTHGCIVRTKEAGTDLRYGVDFEHGIPDLLRQTGII